MSLKPGTQQYTTVDAARSISQRLTTLESITQDGMTPVEYGRTAAASKYTEAASSGDDIPGA